MKLKSIFAVVDAVAVLLIVEMAIFTASRDVIILLISALLLFIWHVLENNFLKRRYTKKKVPEYPGGLAWPNCAFAAMLTAAAAERVIFGTLSNLSVAAFFDVRTSLFIAVGGCTIMILGLLLRTWSYITIKDEFTRPPGKNQNYIKRGPYRFFKHPANLGLLLLGIGVSISFSSLLGIVTAIVLLFPSLIYVGYIEEKLRRDLKQQG